MNKKRLQIYLSGDAWKAVEDLVSEANQGFESGSINCSDAINEMVLNSKVDIKTLQFKHTDFRRSLRVMASKDSLDLDSDIKTVLELKAKAPGRKTSKPASMEDGQGE